MIELATTNAATTQVLETPTKLSREQYDAMDKFIGKCVRKDAKLQGSKFGAVTPLTVQELYKSNVITLQKQGQLLKKAIDEHDPEFTNSPVPLVSGIPASEWIDFIRLLIKRARWSEYAAKKRSQVANLQETINKNKSGDEIRKEAETELAAIANGEYAED